MTVEAIMAVAPNQVTNLTEGFALDSTLATPGAQASDSLSAFGRMVSQGIASVNHDLVVSQTDLQELATGNAQNLHQIMIRLEETRLSFQMFMQVRNRLLEAYQDIMKMQV